jgi:hypothetical protein
MDASDKRIDLAAQRRKRTDRISSRGIASQQKRLTAAPAKIQLAAST